MRGGALKDALVSQVCLFAKFVKDLVGGAAGLL